MKKIKKCVEQKKGDNKTSVNHTGFVFNTGIMITQKNAFVNRNLQKSYEKMKILYRLAKSILIIIAKMPCLKVDNFLSKMKNCAICAKKT